MKKNILLTVLALALGAGAAFAHCGNCPGDKKAEVKKEAPAAKPAGHDCGNCPMSRKETQKKHAANMCGGVTCPENIKGAETSTIKTKNGVETTVTAKNPETIAQIQELALVHYGPKAEKCPGCPTTVPGAETKFENTASGIKVTITGKTPETVKKIQQAAAAEHSAGRAQERAKGPAAARAAHATKKAARTSKKYTCAMKCTESDKPGKCPKCGMPMEEKK